MIYIRNIFQQDLRDGKQIAFPKEVSNQFFNFSYQNNDPDRSIVFIYKENESSSPFYTFNNTNITTRLYAAGTESRIDGELKRFLIDNLNAQINDKLLIRKLNDNRYEFEFIPQNSSKHDFVASLLRNNHEVLLSQNINEEEQPENDELIIHSNSNLRQIICDSFKYLFENYNESQILDGYQIKPATIEDRNYIGITLPKYFNFEIVFGQFESEQSIENLKSSDTRRFFLDKFTLLHKSYNYLNNQWYEISERALRLENFNVYLADISSNRLKIIKQDDVFKLISNQHQPKNTIYYGAPGTGKSFKVDQIIKDLDSKFYERITFHPEYDNGTFVGGYKPTSEKKNEEEEVITYKFIPQAFSNIYSKAWKDQSNNYYLVIEEINRGNCAEIFGEIFQLLDRNSGYTVSPSKELKEYLIKEFDNDGNHEGIVNGLKLPSNLHILATMNTSDQSLFPMDSAFKRRWEWEYVPICYAAQDEDGKENASFSFEIDLKDGTKYSWIDFIAKVNNNHIKINAALGMDKCIGNYFIKPISGNTIELKPFINKVVFYLWNDVFKDEDNRVFETNGSYEDFFPINTNGLNKVKELFERIELSPKPTNQQPEDGEDLPRENEPVA